MKKKLTIHEEYGLKSLIKHNWTKEDILKMFDKLNIKLNKEKEKYKTQCLKKYELWKKGEDSTVDKILNCNFPANFIICKPEYNLAINLMIKDLNDPDFYCAIKFSKDPYTLERLEQIDIFNYLGAVDDNKGNYLTLSFKDITAKTIINYCKKD